MFIIGIWSLVVPIDNNIEAVVPFWQSARLILLVWEHNRTFIFVQIMHYCISIIPWVGWAISTVISATSTFKGIKLETFFCHLHFWFINPAPKTFTSCFSIYLSCSMKLMCLLHYVYNIMACISKNYFLNNFFVLERVIVIFCNHIHIDGA